jgi:predicted RNase H-like HicB family nuclease
MNLIALIHGRDGNYGVSFPDLPGCISQGGSLDDALANAQEAALFHFEGMVEQKLSLPTARSVNALKQDPEYSEDFASAALIAVIAVEPPARAVRVNITLDEHLLGAIDRAAASAGATRSGFLADAARTKLQAR